MSARSALLIASFLALSACGGADLSAAPPAAAAPSTPVPATAAPTATADPIAPREGMQASPHDRDDPDGVRRWTSWDGPRKGIPVTTRRAWVMAPNLMGQNVGDRSSFASVYPRLVEVVSSSADELVFVEQGHSYGVPAFLVRPVFAGQVAQGAVARCSFGGNSVVGRITEARADSVTCTFLFIGKVKNEQLRHDEVLPLGDSLEFGSVAHARFEPTPEDVYPAIVARVEGERSWVLLDVRFSDGHPMAGHPLHETKATDLRAVDLRATLSAGAPCLAAKFGTLEPCKVVKPIEGGLGYEVRFGEGSPERLEDLGSVSAAHE